MDKSQLIETLKNNNVVVMPTDTVYGLACSALLPVAVIKMYKIKQRENKPGTILVANISQLVSLGFNQSQVEQAQKYWPGPVSVVLTAPDSLEYLHMGKKSLAVRIPEPKWLIDLLEKTGPLATTSANLPGEPTITDINQAKDLFGTNVDSYIDGGEISGTKPSKIIKILQNGSTETIRP